MLRAVANGADITLQPIQPKEPRVAYVNWSDSIGGAAKVANRLRQSLNAAGEFAVDLFAANVAAESDAIQLANDPLAWKGRLLNRIDRAPLLSYPRRSPAPFSVNWVPTDRRVGLLSDYQLIHLHWTGGGLLNVSSLRRVGAPVVWTLHDMWPVSGGCHIEYQCLRLIEGCGACPVLGSSTIDDLSRKLFGLKDRALSNCNMTFVAPSHWVAEVARRSPMTQGRAIRVIPNGVDTAVFHCRDRQATRDLLRVPSDCACLLFGAVNSTLDPNKGYKLLQLALQELSPLVERDRVALIVFGSNQTRESSLLGFRMIEVGHIWDEDDMARLYSASDVTVVPSRFESFGQTALESLACGTPVVAFDGSGVAEVVEHGRTGYLAEPYSESDFARGILAWIQTMQSDGTRRDCASSAERRFSIQAAARSYGELYRELIH